eukprot:6580138-Pyramimonas_sp.AAC.1
MGKSAAAETRPGGARSRSERKQECTALLPKWAWGRHAGAATESFGGAPYGATKLTLAVCLGRT